MKTRYRIIYQNQEHSLTLTEAFNMNYSPEIQESLILMSLGYSDHTEYYGAGDENFEIFVHIDHRMSDFMNLFCEIASCCRHQVATSCLRAVGIRAQNPYAPDTEARLAILNAFGHKLSQK
jgi:hypothetical protein